MKKKAAVRAFITSEKKIKRWQVFIANARLMDITSIMWLALKELVGGGKMKMSNTDVITEVLLKFTEPYVAIGETRHDEKAYINLIAICDIYDYCYDLIRENAELKGNEWSIAKAREKAIRCLSEHKACTQELLDDLKAESEE